MASQDAIDMAPYAQPRTRDTHHTSCQCSQIYLLCCHHRICCLVVGTPVTHLGRTVRYTFWSQVSCPSCEVAGSWVLTILGFDVQQLDLGF